MTAVAAEPSPPGATRRAVLNTIKGSLGNLVEWYDVYTYTVFVSYFEGQFFDPQDRNSTVYAYAIFAVTFVARPLGSWFFGRYADRHGRRAALTFSVTVMAVGSFLIAVLPTRDSIGIWAAVLLTLLRLVQGFATGGEYGTSATYMSETATRERRGFFSSFQYVTLVGGQVLAQLTLLILVAALSKDQLSTWGWRIPFALGGVAAVIVFWLRRTMDESLAVPRDRETTANGSLVELLTRHFRALVLCFLVTLGGTIAFYTYSVNAPAIVKSTYTDRALTATWVNLLSLVVLMALQPLGGLLSDKVGRKPLLVGFGIGGVLYTWLLITALPRVHNPVLTFLILVVGYVILTGYTSINALVKSELFPAYVRALGVGLGYGLANSIFGGTAPLIYQALKGQGMVPLFVGYVTVCIAVSLVVYIVFLRNKSETHLDAEYGHAFQRADPGVRE